MLRHLIVLVCVLAGLGRYGLADATDRPNILWIYVEDLSPYFGCYGNEINRGHTPQIDALAEQGVLFERCFMPAPVCSPCRSALITGVMQTTIGVHQHRSSRDDRAPIYLPEGMKTIPELFRDAGYYTFNRGKDDYNFIYNRDQLYSGTFRTNRFYGRSGQGDWKNRAEGQPFFGQIQLSGGKHLGRVKSGRASVEPRVDREAVEVPPYLPDLPVIREQFALHHETARVTDQEVGAILDQLEVDGLLKDTIVFFFSDHGMNNSMRAKQYCYDEGLHVPLIVVGKGRGNTIHPGGRRRDLVSGLDISATTLALAGIEGPKYLDGRDLFAVDHQSRGSVISARDRCDYSIDRIRTVRTDRFRYVRNFLTDRPLLQPGYRDSHDHMIALREAFDAGALNEVQSMLFGPPRLAEELYDIEVDPHQINNLAGDPAHAATLAEHRAILDDWIGATDDQGQYPESEAALRVILERWGEKCMNPEYDALRDRSGGEDQ